MGIIRIRVQGKLNCRPHSFYPLKSSLKLNLTLTIQLSIQGEFINNQEICSKPPENIRCGPEDDHDDGEVAGEHDEDGEEQRHRHHEQEVVELLEIGPFDKIIPLIIHRIMKQKPDTIKSSFLLVKQEEYIEILLRLILK